MTFGSWFRAVGQSINHLSVGIGHFATAAVNKVAGVATHVFDGGVSLGTAIGTVAHKAGGAVKGVASSLSLPIDTGVDALGGMFLLKQR